MQRVLTAGVLAAALTMPAATEAATFATFTDAGAFAATLGTSLTDGYEDPGYQTDPFRSFFSDAAMSAIVGETRYTSTGFSNFNAITHVGTGSSYCAGCNGSFLLSFDQTSVGTSEGVFGVGLQYYNLGNPLYVAFVTFGDGSTENVTLQQTADETLSEYFGITSPDLISSIAFGLPDGGTSMEGRFGIDTLTIGAAPTAAIPLPGGLTLSLAGLAALAGLGLARPRRAPASG